MRAFNDIIQENYKRCIYLIIILKKSLNKIKNAVKNVNGLFIIAFSNSDFTNIYSKKVFRTLLTADE